MATIADIKVLKANEYVSVDIRGGGAATIDRAGNTYAFDLVAVDGGNQSIEFCKTGVNDDANTVSFAPCAVPAGFPAKDYAIKNVVPRKVNGAWRITFQYIIMTPDGKGLKDVLAYLSDVDVDMTVQGGGGTFDPTQIYNRLAALEQRVTNLENEQKGGGVDLGPITAELVQISGEIATLQGNDTATTTDIAALKLMVAALQTSEVGEGSGTPNPPTPTSSVEDALRTLSQFIKGA